MGSHSAANLVERDIPLSDFQKEKEILRRRAYDARNGEKDQELCSKKAVKNLVEIDEYKAAETVLWYVDSRSELQTQAAIAAALKTSKRIIVPYCTKGEKGENKLGLWPLQSMEDLVAGKWKILEPPREEWGKPEKQVAETELDLIVAPGVAFGRDGARLGNGQGYYDRLFAKVRSDCKLIGFCYESQLLDDITMEPHDVYVDKVITEARVYEGRGRVESEITTTV